MKSVPPSISLIVVKDVMHTSKLLCDLFHWKSTHGGNEFDILKDENNTPAILLHAFNSHDHARFNDIEEKALGVGSSLYIFVKGIDLTYEKVQKNENLIVIEELFLNKNSGAREFTFCLQEGHKFSVCESGTWL